MLPLGDCSLARRPPCPHGSLAGVAIDAAQPGSLDEDGASLDRLTGGVELVAVEPDPTGVRRPIMYPDYPEEHRPGELHAGLTCDLQDIAGAG